MFDLIRVYLTRLINRVQYKEKDACQIYVLSFIACNTQVRNTVDLYYKSE